MSTPVPEGLEESKRSNWERTEWRQRCRNVLSEHIKLRLGIVVDPSEVRLIPGGEDRYRWSYLDHKAHLFGKQLSKHNVSGYRQLCREVGRSFEAVPTQVTVQQGSEDSSVQKGLKPCGLEGAAQEAEAPSTAEEESYTVTIQTLRSTKQRLSEELASSHVTISQNEEEIAQLREALERMAIDNLRCKATLQLRTSEAHRCGRDLERQSSWTKMYKEVIEECLTNVRNLEHVLDLGLKQSEEHEPAQIRQDGSAKGTGGPSTRFPAERKY